jgi:hypothetical protein
MLEKKPFTSLEIEQLSDELRRITDDLFIQVLTLLGSIVLVALKPARHGHESLVSRHGVVTGLLIALLVGLATFCWNLMVNRNNFKKDLQNGTKVIRQTSILRKERSFLRKKFYVLVDEKDDVKKQFEVEESIYNKLQVGQRVSLEFAPYSKHLLNIDWQV